jgi:hypothetical protein
MPTYLILGDCSTLKVNNDQCSTICKDTTKFFGTLANKLLNMAEKIHDKIEKLKTEVCLRPQKGFVFAEIDAPKMVLGVRYEYVEYVRRYGPPENGVFDEERLEVIRSELGIRADSAVI